MELELKKYASKKLRVMRGWLLLIQSILWRLSKKELLDSYRLHSQPSHPSLMKKATTE